MNELMHGEVAVPQPSRRVISARITRHRAWPYFRSQAVQKPGTATF
jgi:hypothetical protein